MNYETVTKLSDKELRLKVAELCGITAIHKPDKEDEGICVKLGYDLIGHKEGRFAVVPAYPQDLDACREFEQHIILESIAFKNRYEELLDGMCMTKSNDPGIFASARQRSEAFVLVVTGEV